ncbi:MAG TPA: cell division protein, partial [Rhodospirillales bacterium]|nr:cell division protein [Rhodospirillales bacterium]
MFSRRSDLQLERDSLGRFLPWLIAFMVYLSILAMAGMLSLNNLAERWDTGLSGTLTVQVPASQTEDEKSMAAILAVLNKTPGIARVQRLSEQQLLALLEPWLGPAAGADDLPLPRLIDVELAGGATVAVAALQKRLDAIVAGTLVDDHGVWLERLLTLIKTVQALASAVLALIGLATIGTVVFTTRTGLAIHQDAIEVLHLIGAQDAYIARQFSSRALMLGLKGGLISLALALPT